MVGNGLFMSKKHSQRNWMKMGQKKQTTQRTKIKFDDKNGKFIIIIFPLPWHMAVCDKICVEIWLTGTRGTWRLERIISIGKSCGTFWCLLGNHTYRFFRVKMMEKICTVICTKLLVCQCLLICEPNCAKKFHNIAMHLY